MMVLGMEWDGCMTGAALVVWVVFVLLFGYGAVDTREKFENNTLHSTICPISHSCRREEGSGQEVNSVLLQRCIGSLSGYSLAWIQTLVPASLCMEPAIHACICTATVSSSLGPFAVPNSSGVNRMQVVRGLYSLGSASGKAASEYG
jgi:hypothetical protein